MTKDTERALAIIEPMARELGIKVTADDSRLYCNHQSIGIGCNSTYATVCEFVAYAMYHMSTREYRYSGSLGPKALHAIKRYWIET